MFASDTRSLGGGWSPAWAQQPRKPPRRLVGSCQSFNCLISGVEPHVSALTLAQNALIIAYPAFNDDVPGDDVFPTFPFMSLSDPEHHKIKEAQEV